MISNLDTSKIAAEIEGDHKKVMQKRGGAVPREASSIVVGSNGLALLDLLALPQDLTPNPLNAQEELTTTFLEGVPEEL